MTYRTLHFALFWLAVAALCSCSRPSETKEALCHAESIMEEHPDSALAILRGIPGSALESTGDKARHALLLSMALDKNYIDLTDFSVLQPAIDYFADHGSPDEKMRTHYYKGRIFQNRSDDDKAMDAFVDALDLKDRITDSLTLARAYTAQSIIYNKLYKSRDFLENSLKAASIYTAKGKYQRATRALNKAFNGAVLVHSRELCDSIYSEIYKLSSDPVATDSATFSLRLSYALNFCNDSTIENVLLGARHRNFSSLELMDICRAYLRLDMPDKAKEALDMIDVVDSRDSLKYLSLRSETYEKCGDIANSLNSFKEYYFRLDSIHTRIFSHDLQFAEERHKLEMANFHERHNSNMVGWTAAICIAVLLLVVSLVYLKYRLAKVRRIQAENQMRLAKAEIRNERSEKEALADKLEILGREYHDLQEAIERDSGASEVYGVHASNILRERLMRLNDFLSSHITGDKRKQHEYITWARELVDDRRKFMSETREAFTESHPRFIKYLREHDLTTDEIEYICLYCLGLRGKEIGNYMHKSGHYNISKELRRKLGMDDARTNIGNYARELLDRFAEA